MKKLLFAVPIIGTMLFSVSCTKEPETVTGTVYNKINRQEMPVLSRGQPLTFSRKDLQHWIRNGRPTLAEMKVENILRS
jgi:hypothetical protein